MLSILGHVVSLIQDDDFVVWTFDIPGLFVYLLVWVFGANLGCILLDLLSHLIDSSIIRSIQFKHSLPVEVLPK